MTPLEIYAVIVSVLVVWQHVILRRANSVAKNAINNCNEAIALNNRLQAEVIESQRQVRELLDLVARQTAAHNALIQRLNPSATSGVQV